MSSPFRILPTVFVLFATVASGAAADPLRQFVARDGAIHIVQDGQDTAPFVHAVNLGVAVPGTRPGELAATREQYDRWFARMRAMGFTAVRIYTLHYPRFYEALRDYNLLHPDAPLYLLHGVWLDEENPSGSLDLHGLTPIFREGITQAVAAVHGSITIPERFGRAYGTYAADVSPWVMGWIMGREIYQDEVRVTNEAHPGDLSFDGQLLDLPQGSPTEVWLATQLDFLAVYERDSFGAARPLSVSSWPTLDPLYHLTEYHDPLYPSGEDDQQFDLANLDTKDFPPGYFASFHAYPYYPDFMSEEPDYTSVRDLEGPNSYLGYLRALHDHYYPKPLFIAEFGVPSSWGDAHVAQSGMDHGGHDEVAQGRYGARLFHNQAEAGCAGGALFAWIDEWWKNTWITQYLDFPIDRRPLWLNVTAPEQNFGLIAFDDPPPSMAPAPLTGATGPVSNFVWGVSGRFFHLEFDTDTAARPLVIGFDTYADDRGETILPGGVATAVRSEFALVLDTNNEAQLYVTHAYDLFGLWHEAWNYVKDTNQLYHSTATDGAEWKRVRWLSNRPHGSNDGKYNFPETVSEVGRLGVSTHGDFVSSRDALALANGHVRLRLPWTLLQFTDPSQRMVTDDDRTTPVREKVETTQSEGIRVVIVHGGGQAVSERLRWAGWEMEVALAAQKNEREKASLPIIERYLLGYDLADDIRIRIVDYSENRFTLDWTGGGTLLEAPTPTGPWSSRGLRAPAFVLKQASGSQYFRVRR
jgi:hypothetical protein